MDLKTKQTALKSLASEANPDTALLKELMQQTNCLQRADINTVLFQLWFSSYSYCYSYCINYFLVAVIVNVNCFIFIWLQL